MRPLPAARAHQQVQARCRRPVQILNKSGGRVRGKRNARGPRKSVSAFIVHGAARCSLDASTHIAYATQVLRRLGRGHRRAGEENLDRAAWPAWPIASCKRREPRGRRASAMCSTGLVKQAGQSPRSCLTLGLPARGTNTRRAPEVGGGRPARPLPFRVLAAAPAPTLAPRPTHCAMNASAGPLRSSKHRGRRGPAPRLRLAARPPSRSPYDGCLLPAGHGCHLQVSATLSGVGPPRCTVARWAMGAI